MSARTLAEAPAAPRIPGLRIPRLPDYRFLHAIAAQPFVAAITLYGSRARGDNFPRSDIDLAISCPDASQRDWARVLDIIEEADTLHFIDCVRLDDLAPGDPLRRAIERDGVVIFRRDPDGRAVGREAGSAGPGA